MKFFIDTADINEIKDLAKTGLIDGVTTNPSLLAQHNQPLQQVIKEICQIIPGPVSAEVVATNYDGMIEEGHYLSKISPNVVIKVPLTYDGIRACRTFSQEGISVNVTLCFSPTQALLAAKAGAAFISPFIGRLDDIGETGMAMVAQIKEIYENYPNFQTEILVASVRHPLHVVEAARLGADVVTIPPKVFRQLYNHPLTDKGLDLFLKDWQRTGQTIK